MKKLIQIGKSIHRQDAERITAHNSGFKKLAVQWLIEHSTSHQLLWCIDIFVLRNPPLRQAPKRYATL